MRVYRWFQHLVAHPTDLNRLQFSQNVKAPLKSKRRSAGLHKRSRLHVDFVQMTLAEESSFNNRRPDDFFRDVRGKVRTAEKQWHIFFTK